jgi:hypothetical protein
MPPAGQAVCLAIGKCLLGLAAATWTLGIPQATILFFPAGLTFTFVAWVATWRGHFRGGFFFNSASRR